MSCFGDFSDFSYFVLDLFRQFRWVRGAVLGILAVSATFFQNFSSFWAGLGVKSKFVCKFIFQLY
ncbi:hypothetical protein DW775_15465, partial [Agathobacter rectalis]